LTSGSMHAERLLEYMCTKFGVDSSSHFPLRERGQTRLNALPTLAAMPAWVMIQ